MGMGLIYDYVPWQWPVPSSPHSFFLICLVGWTVGGGFSAAFPKHEFAKMTDISYTSC